MEPAPSNGSAGLTTINGVVVAPADQREDASRPKGAKVSLVR